MLQFNALLRDAGIDPADVRLLRHLPSVGDQPLLDIWRADPARFEAYQALQLSRDRTSFARRYWASFIGTWDGRTVFAGLYENLERDELSGLGVDPISGARIQGEVDSYQTCLLEVLESFRGRLFIEWGGGASGKRAWNQKADVQEKTITELHRNISEQPFPGLLAINMPLSQLATISPAWVEHLAAAKGVYLLSCPRDGALYVGSATAAGGFWARWSSYLANGNGGNLGLINRPPSDFFTSIVQVAGSAETAEDILIAEARWKEKLRTREWGLNHN